MELLFINILSSLLAFYLYIFIYIYFKKSLVFGYACIVCVCLHTCVEVREQVFPLFCLHIFQGLNSGSDAWMANPAEPSLTTYMCKFCVCVNIWGLSQIMMALNATLCFQRSINFRKFDIHKRLLACLLSVFQFLFWFSSLQPLFPL